MQLCNEPIAGNLLGSPISASGELALSDECEPVKIEDLAAAWLGTLDS